MVVGRVLIAIGLLLENEVDDGEVLVCAAFVLLDLDGHVHALAGVDVQVVPVWEKGELIKINKI